MQCDQNTYGMSFAYQTNLNISRMKQLARKRNSTKDVTLSF